jgi:hypothetical protein
MGNITARANTPLQMVNDIQENSKTGIFMAREGLSMLMAPGIQAGLKMGEETAGGSIQIPKALNIRASSLMINFRGRMICNTGRKKTNTIDHM